MPTSRRFDRVSFFCNLTTSSNRNLVYRFLRVTLACGCWILLATGTTSSFTTTINTTTRTTTARQVWSIHGHLVGRSKESLSAYNYYWSQTCFLHHQTRRSTMTTTSRHLTSPSSNDNDNHDKHRMLEVEQKFIPPVDLHQRLTTAGFVPTQSIELVDWYWDVQRQKNHETDDVTLQDDFPLIDKGCWFRCRQRIVNEIKDNKDNDDDVVWELKRDVRLLKMMDDHNDCTMTTNYQSESRGASVYEETQGDKAITIVQSIIEQTKTNNNPEESTKITTTTTTPTVYQGHNVPQLPATLLHCPLTPFARIHSKRTSYAMTADTLDKDHPFADLTVDVDATIGYDHAIGEVETLVREESQVSQARSKINDFLQDVVYGANEEDTHSTKTATNAAKGKLELYLELFQPALFTQLVQRGLL